MKHLILSVSLCLLACSPVKSASDETLDLGYAFVGAGAMTVKAADHACSQAAFKLAGFSPEGQPPEVIDHAKLLDGIALADKCAASAEKSRAALDAAEQLLETWSAAKTGALVCAAGRFLDSADSFLKLLDEVGTRIPDEAMKGIQYGKIILTLVPSGASCSMPDAGGG